MTPRPAATLLLVRQGPIDIEVLMVERPARGYFGGLWVFPGGGVEPADESPPARRVVSAPEVCDDFAWRAAALRETVEEVGFALTDPPLSTPITGTGADVYRELDRRQVRLAGDRLRLLSQWVTPQGAPTRFDARFYLAHIEGDPPLLNQPGEIVSHAWTVPAAALERVEAQEWAMVTPTLHHLEWLARYREAAEAWEAATEATGARVEPVVETDGSQVRVRLPAVADLP